MSAIYDNWERLVAAVLKKQQLWELFHAQSRSPSTLSEASNLSSRSLGGAAFDFSGLASPSNWQDIEDAVAKLQIASPKLVFISDFSPAFDVEDVFLDYALLLGSGTFGSAYMAAMENGVKFLVKRLKSVNISEAEFKRQMEIVGNVRHENVAALRAYYWSQDEKIMLHDYYSNGSVFALLHGLSGKDPAHINWNTRVRIALGAARGVAKIHTQNGGHLVHGNIKSSNIFLNERQYGCVSDLGVAIMTATTFNPAALCYAPEVKNSQNVSHASDVYSFGILILELLTRKSPVHVRRGVEAVDLVKLVNSVKSKDRAAKVFDADLLQYPNIKDEMVKMLQIGINCVAKSIRKRPKMSEVVKLLEDLNLDDVRASVSTGGDLVFVKDSNPTFDLETVLRASAEVLGKGTFGTSYKATMENGEIVVVKRLKDVNATFSEFQQHVEVIGKIWHTNVAKLRAYYFSKDEVLLLYDFYSQNSASSVLHGKFGTDKIPLDWETRYKIALGAARGVAHIHQQDDRMLVHGNIKSSNILLKGQEEDGLVSDVGLAKLMKPIRGSDMRARGYFAPELRDTSNASQASDAYSFGVLLLELVTGKPCAERMHGGKNILLVDWVQSFSRDEWDAEVIDFEVLRYGYQEEAMELLGIAMDCVNVVPERRPRMPQVVKMLEEITGLDQSNESRLEDAWEQPSIELRLEHLLEDLLPTLTP